MIHVIANVKGAQKIFLCSSVVVLSSSILPRLLSVDHLC